MFARFSFTIANRGRGVRFFSSVNNKNLIFSPEMKLNAKIIVPVSMGRYDSSKKQSAQYDELLSSLFGHLSFLLKRGVLFQVDVLSTADLQRINWDDQKTDEIENHFFSTHKDILKEVSNSFRWNEWLEKSSKDEFEEKYNFICEKSKPGTEWNDLMVKTHLNVKMSSSLEKSLEYQRREYAAVMMMAYYNNLLYTGPISTAWAYMYHIINVPLPVFTKARMVDYRPEKDADVDIGIGIALSGAERILTSHNVSDNRKRNLSSQLMELIYANNPRDKKDDDTWRPKGPGR